jgi:hypothetical protein
MIKEIEIPEGYEARIEGNKVLLELKESEGERIRYELIGYLTHRAEVAGFIDECEDCKRWLAYLEKQKEQDIVECGALHEAFVNSKRDYTLEEKCDASDYANTILPTSVTYGENDEEYKLHKIIEAAFIAGQQKEQQAAEWSEEDDFMATTVENSYYCHCGKMTDRLSEQYKKFFEKVKSLRPHPHWKPSEEQMEVLGRAITFLAMHDEEFRRTGRNNGLINDLFNDLKKLM